MQTLTEELKRRAHSSEFRRKENTTGSKCDDGKSVNNPEKVGGIALVVMWVLLLSFGAAVWYWLISSASAFLAVLK